MPTHPELERVADIQRENAKLESEIAQIEKQLQKNYRRMIRGFFPYLLSVYAGWRPQLGETAISINLEQGHCFEVTIRSVDGYRVRAQEGKKAVYHVFDLNPRVEEYEVASFVIPKQDYMNDVKGLFGLQFLQ
jgi:hypothetical protein